MKKKTDRPDALWTLLKRASHAHFLSDSSMRSAALSYYTVFSIAPVLIIVIAIAGLVFGPEAVRGEIKTQIGGLVGKDGATQVETMIKGAYNPGKGKLAATVAFVVLLVGATAVFSNLRASLNFIWEVKPRPGPGYLRVIFDRILSFAMAGVLGFLLLVSLVVQAGLAALTKEAGDVMPDAVPVLAQVLEVVLSLSLSVALFTILYKFMSDARVRWFDAVSGAVLTGVLFTAGKFAIGAYLGYSRIADAYGVAGSVVVLLLWVFYSSQILFFGAQFVRVLADARGHPVSPGPKAVASEVPG